MHIKGIRRSEAANSRAPRGISEENGWVEWQGRISNSAISVEFDISSVSSSLDENILSWSGHVCVSHG